LYRRVASALLAGVALLLSGCWTPHSANIRPAGQPRVIADGVAVEWVAGSARVASIDRADRTVTLSVRRIVVPACKIGQDLRNWGDIQVGDEVRATIREILTVYVAAAKGSSYRNEQLPRRPPDAYVLAVERSYRLLTVQYPQGGRQTFKVGLHIAMTGIDAGDAVAISRAEVVELHAVRGHSNGQESSSSRHSTK
jgi:hypothetical protein